MLLLSLGKSLVELPLQKSVVGNEKADRLKGLKATVSIIFVVSDFNVMGKYSKRSFS